MIYALTAGVVLGLSAGLAPGPLLALVVAQTLKHNFREGVRAALAPLITDLPIILVSLLLLTRLTDFKPVLGMISFIGGLYVLYLSYESFRTGPVHMQVSESEPRSLRKASIVNALNPHPYLFWVTVGGPFVIKAHDEHIFAPLTFIFCFYSLLVGSKVLLAVVVGRSRAFLRGKAYQLVMRVLAGLLALFAFLLIRDAIVLLGILRL